MEEKRLSSVSGDSNRGMKQKGVKKFFLEVASEDAALGFSWCC
jgi:hypothetical protein